MDKLYRPLNPSGKAFLKLPLESGHDYKVLIHTNKTLFNPQFKIFCSGEQLDYESSKSRIFLILPKKLVTQGNFTKLEFVLEGQDHKNLKWDRAEDGTGIAFRQIEIDIL
jgi:hypothetical protein